MRGSTIHDILETFQQVFTVWPITVKNFLPPTRSSTRSSTRFHPGGAEFSEPQMAIRGRYVPFLGIPISKTRVSLYLYIYIVIKSKIGLVQVHSPNSQTSFYGYVFLPHIYIIIYIYVCVCKTCVIYFHHQNLETSPGAGPLKESLGVAVCGLRGHLTCKA